MSGKDELDPNINSENVAEKNVVENNKDLGKGGENINNLSIRKKR